MTAAKLDLNTSTSGERCTIRLAGELDMASAPRLEDAVASALAGGAAELVLDMHAVTFTDSCGLRAILRGRRSWEGSGRRFFLVRAEREQHRLFEVSGMIGDLTFRPPPGGAADEQPPGPRGEPPAPGAQPPV